MFHVIFLKQLTEEATKQAITKPIEDAKSPLKFSKETVDEIAKLSGGYPYFIQFICKEVFDVWIAKIHKGEIPKIPKDDIIRKLDTDFFQGRWARATDRQRSLLRVIAELNNLALLFLKQRLILIQGSHKHPVRFAIFKLRATRFRARCGCCLLLRRLIGTR